MCEVRTGDRYNVYHLQNTKLILTLREGKQYEFSYGQSINCGALVGGFSHNVNENPAVCVEVFRSVGDGKLQNNTNEKPYAPPAAAETKTLRCEWKPYAPPGAADLRETIAKTSAPPASAETKTLRCEWQPYAPPAAADLRETIAKTSAPPASADCGAFGVFMRTPKKNRHGPGWPWVKYFGGDITRAMLTGFWWDHRVRVIPEKGQT